MGVKPFRGDQVAAGVVVLGLLVVLLNVRMTAWSSGVHLAYTLAAAGGCAVLGFPVRRPAGQRGPRAWETTILVVCWLLSAVSVGRVVDLVADDPGAGAATVVLVLLGALGLAIALRGAGTGSLLAALGFGGAVLAFADVVADPSTDAYRVLLLLELVGFVFLAVAHRDRRPHHAAQLANAAALAALGIAVIGLVELVPLLLGGGSFSDGNDAFPQWPGWGWDLVLLVAGFGAIAFGAVDRHRGPVLLGALVLAGFVASTPDGDLLGWPLVLAVAAGFLLVVGLRPSRELPPPPDEEGEPVQPLPLRGSVGAEGAARRTGLLAAAGAALPSAFAPLTAGGPGTRPAAARGDRRALPALRRDPRIAGRHAGRRAGPRRLVDSARARRDRRRSRRRGDEPAPRPLGTGPGPQPPRHPVGLGARSSSLTIAKFSSEDDDGSSKLPVAASTIIRRMNATPIVVPIQPMMIPAFALPSPPCLPAERWISPRAW